MKNEQSHKVLAQGLSSLLTLAKAIPENSQIHARLIDLAKLYLKDISHSVKCRCLEILGTLTPATPESESILELAYSYYNNDDARVRAQAFATLISLHNRGLKLNASIYGNVCDALKDDYEIVRRVVLELICLLGKTYPEK